MGYYRSRSNDKWKSDKWKPKMGGAGKWVAAVVVSALVGSGATLAVDSAMNGTSTTPTAMNAPTASSSSSAPMSSNIDVNVNDAITNVVKKAEPDVVAVVNYTTSRNFFSQQSQTQESDIGSGVFFQKDNQYAYIVTNNHVVQGGSKVNIVLKSGKQVKAQVVGTDPYTDLAVLKVPIANFKSVQPMQFANSDDIQVGEPAIAIGTPMGLDFADTVTAGIVSGKQRMMPVEEPDSKQTLDYQPVIQTDAAINPGNSGGPLLNASGQMIGINSSKIVAQDFNGMGFAIPANEVENVAAQIIKTGHAVHPALGIEAIDMSTIPQGYLPDVPVDYGIYVASVTSANAKAAGLKKGDIIIGINGKAVQTTADLRTALFKTKPGDMIKVTIYRGSKKMTLNVKVGKEQSPNTTASGSNQSGSGGGMGGGSQNGGSGLDPFSGFPFGGFGQ